MDDGVLLPASIFLLESSNREAGDYLSLRWNEESIHINEKEEVFII